MEAAGIRMGVWLVCAHAPWMDKSTHPARVLGKDVGDIRAFDDGLEGSYWPVDMTVMRGVASVDINTSYALSLSSLSTTKPGFIDNRT